jgi:hypothetical protein
MFYPKFCEDCTKKFDEEIEKAKPYALLYEEFLNKLCPECKSSTQKAKEDSGC